MGSNEIMFNLMLDALRRGILIARGHIVSSGVPNEISLIEQKKRVCQSIIQLSDDQRLQVCLAIVKIAGYEALGEHNNGCFVDITDWDAGQIKKLSDVIQFASSK